MAQEAGLDLVEVAPNVRPPVCRIMDYGKWKYNQKKKARKPHEQVLKEIRLRPKTDDHDRAIKIRQAIQFLQKGDKVQFTMRFRGRERAHRDLALEILQSVAAQIGDQARIERPPVMDGRNMIMILAPARPVAGEVRRSEPAPQTAAGSLPAEEAPAGGPATAGETARPEQAASQAV